MDPMNSVKMCLLCRACSSCMCEECPAYGVRLFSLRVMFNSRIPINNNYCTLARFSLGTLYFTHFHTHYTSSLCAGIIGLYFASLARSFDYVTQSPRVGSVSIDASHHIVSLYSVVCFPILPSPVVYCTAGALAPCPFIVLSSSCHSLRPCSV